MGLNAAGRRFAILAAVCGVASVAFSPCRARAQAAHLSSGCAAGQALALTFDDGPNPPFTTQIVDILTARGVKATFFVEGQQAEAHPDVVRAEREAGMAVGAHSYAHGQDLPSMSAEAFAADFDRGARALTNAMGFEPAIYRSPYGHTSKTMLEVEHERGYTSIGWDVDSTDWKDSSVDEIVAAVLNGAHPGAIVLMHDGGLGGGNPDRTKTIAALPRIIDGLRDRGYVFETVPELTGAPARQGDAGRAACSAN